jgi:hypothetical protein
VALIAFTVFAFALLPASALAARSWQPPIAAPAGYEFGGLGPAVQLDAEGDLAVTVEPPGGAYRYAVRPHAGSLLNELMPFPGTLGEPAILVRETAQNTNGDLLMWNGSGNLVAYRPTPIFSVAFGPASFTNVQSLPAAAGAIRYAAMTPGGEAFAQTLKGDPNEATPTSATFVLSRPSGPSATFGVEPGQRIELPAAPGDTGTEPLGIAADPDGRVTAVYRSLPSLRVIQASAPAGGGGFAGFEEIALTADPAKWQETAVPKIATSYNGHAILVWGTDRTVGAGFKSEIWASRRAPGGAFGPRELVADLDPGHDETDAGSDYGPVGVFGSPDSPELFPVALDSGATLVAFNQITVGDYCSTLESEDDTKLGAFLAARGSGAWLTTALGSNGSVNFSWVDAIASAGDSVALASSELVQTPCAHPPVTSASSARVWQGTTPGAPTALGNFGPNGRGIAVNSAGDAAITLGSPPVLRVYEDPGAAPEDTGNPSNPGGSNSGGGSGGGSGSGTLPIGTGPVPPAKVVAPGGIKLDKPLVVDQRGRQRWFNFSIFCVTTAQVTCTVTATPVPGSPRPFARPTSALAAKKAPALIKPSSGRVAPGKTKALKTYLTAAGAALLKQKGSFRTKVRIVTKAGAAESSEVKTITVKG